MKERLKKYDASRGVQLDANFLSHAGDCEQCRRYDAEKPATLALMCLEGAVLYKRDNAVRPRSETATRAGTYASKATMKSLMRYRGES